MASMELVERLKVEEDDPKKSFAAQTALRCLTIKEKCLFLFILSVLLLLEGLKWMDENIKSDSLFGLLNNFNSTLFSRLCPTKN
jgi:hypothetical protein